VTLPTQYINFDGKLILSSDPLFNQTNRAFAYGDGLFESMHAYGTEIQLADLHFTRLFNGMKTLKMEWNDDFNPSRLTKEISHLLNRNKLFKGTRVRLTIFRRNGGLYRPATNTISYIIESIPLESDFYKLNEKGLQIGVYEEIKKPINILSPYKTCNSIINVMAAIFSQKQGWDDCLITNETGQIIEGYHSNLFVIKNNFLYTPSIESGCVAGVMRQKIIEIAVRLGLKVNQKAIITESLLLEADEILLTNAIEGMRWVMAYKLRRYFNLTARKLNEELNNSVFGNKI
jgi:branched-chain amino acid aminotransferase